jgi:proline iminopeptidase
VVSVDQRNCGRSTPYAGDPSVDLSGNTTSDLIGDLELLRATLNIERWMVAGASWGTTLGLAYAQAHPTVVSGMVLVSTVTTSTTEVEWITRGMGRFFPHQWHQFLEALPEDERGGNLAAAYNRLLLSADPAVHGPAAAAWCSWEETHVATDGRSAHDRRFNDERFRLCFARIVTHYWSRSAFLRNGQLIDNLPQLAGIPAALVHGRQDLSSPSQLAVDIHDAWADSRLTMVDDNGHGATLEAIRTAVKDVTDRSRRRT